MVSLQDSPEKIHQSKADSRCRFAKAATEKAGNGFGCLLVGVDWVDSSRQGLHTCMFRQFKLPLAYSVMIDKKHEYAFDLPLSVCLC